MMRSIAQNNCSSMKEARTKSPATFSRAFNVSFLFRYRISLLFAAIPFFLHACIPYAQHSFKAPSKVRSVILQLGTCESATRKAQGQRNWEALIDGVHITKPAFIPASDAHWCERSISSFWLLTLFFYSNGCSVLFIFVHVHTNLNATNYFHCVRNHRCVLNNKRKKMLSVFKILVEYF